MTILLIHLLKQSSIGEKVDLLQLRKNELEKKKISTKLTTCFLNPHYI